jgi:TRAP-type C4-dicarboxylate transport system substrate-binding protein
MTRSLTSPLLTTALLLGLLALPARAESVLRLGSCWNARQNFTVDFMRYLDSVNTKGRGLVRIEFIGGPEALPEQQLLHALRRGVIDVAFCGITYYRGVLPEGDALFGASIGPDAAHASGAFAALQPYWAARINARLVGWLQSGVGANIWLRRAPPSGTEGLPDLTGLIIRTSPSNRELLTALGARTVQIPVSEIYTALERGMVDGLAFTTIGMPDLGVSRFIRHRIDPPVLRLAVTLQANLDAWAALPPAARRLLETEAVDYERGNRERFAALAARELAALAAEGLVGVEPPPAARARYVAMAREVVWARFARRAPAAAADLKPRFYPEATR